MRKIREKNHQPTHRHSSGKDIARALALPPGVVSEFRATCSCECSRLSHTGCCSIACGLPNRNHRMKQAKGVGLRPSSPAGSASRSLGGNKAKKVAFQRFSLRIFWVSSQQSLAFSAGEPASVFTGTTGVVAGTDVELAQHLQSPDPPSPPQQPRSVQNLQHGYDVGELLDGALLDLLLRPPRLTQTGWPGTGGLFLLEQLEELRLGRRGPLSS